MNRSLTFSLFWFSLHPFPNVCYYFQKFDKVGKKPNSTNEVRNPKQIQSIIIDISYNLEKKNDRSNRYTKSRHFLTEIVLATIKSNTFILIFKSVSGKWNFVLINFVIKSTNSGV